MRHRVSTLLVVLCLVPLLLSAAIASTDRKESGGKRARHISEDVYPSERVSAPSADKYQATVARDESDCYNLIPDPEVPAATEHDLVGLTWYEYQQNGSMGRMISVTSAGTGGYRHISWTWTAGVYPGTQRRVYARSKPAAGAWSTAQEVGLGTVNSGYSNQTHFNDGTSVVIFHRTGIGGNWCYLAVADAPAADPLYTRKWDLPDELPGGAPGEVGAWPKCEVMYCLDSTVYEARAWNYIHYAVTAHNTIEEKATGYARCYIDPTNDNNLICQAPNLGDQYHIPANVPFQGPIGVFGSSCEMSLVVVTGRGAAGKKVAIVYMPMAVPGDWRYYGDVGYVECDDNGDAWIAGGPQWPPVLHKITNYGQGDKERPHLELDAYYDYGDGLHVVYKTCRFDPKNPGVISDKEVRLYHWYKPVGRVLIRDSFQGKSGQSSYNRLNSPSITAKDPIYHPGGDSSYLFCIWTEFDPSDINAAGDQSNGDIFGCGSFDNGNTWGKVLNLTGTHSPGCAAGNCVSEVCPSMAENMLNGDLHIEYICDRDAGAAVQNEGAWTENYVMYMRLPEWIVEPVARGYYEIIDPYDWFHPPIKVLPNQTRSITFKVFSIGNEALTYSVSSDNPCVQVSVPPTQLQPKDSIEISVLLDGTGACNGTFIAGNVILTTDEDGGKVEYLRVHAVVSDEYYECPRDPETVDTLENNYMRLYVNAACQQWIHDIGWEPDTTHEVFFQGGTIVATTSGGDTLVGRFMGDNDLRGGPQDKLYKEQCEPDWEPHFWILFTKEIYIEASHLNPPNHFKWFWWEIAKQVKFFKDTAPPEYQRIVIKYIKVKRQDPPGWWPDLTPFTGYEDTYIGFAMDIDAPWDSADVDPPTPNVGDESATNLGGYDATNHIAYLTGYGNHEHPEYSDFHAGIALAEGGSPLTTPLAAAIIKNNHYLYPTSPWGWIDGELYQLAKGLPSNPYIEDPDSLVDRSIVMTAAQIPGGTDPGTKAEFTIIEAIAPTGLAQLQTLVALGRDVVALERTKGIPAACGDANGDYVVNVGDIVYLVTYLYKSGPAPLCPLARGDANNDGVINVGDVVYLVTFAYKGGPQPVCPGIWYW